MMHVFLGALLKIIDYSSFTAGRLCCLGLPFLLFKQGDPSPKQKSPKVQFQSILGSFLPPLSWFYLAETLPSVDIAHDFGSESGWEQPPLWLLLIHPPESSTSGAGALPAGAML